MRLMTATLVVLGAAVSGCGGYDCSKPFSACGGNIVGTWHPVTVCGSTQSSSSGCQGETSSGNLNTSGSVVFNSDGTFSINETVSGTATDTFPKSCLPQFQSCDQVAAFVSATGPMASCSGDISVSCTCQVTLKEMTVTANGTYTTSGSTVTLMQQGSSGGNPASYCVQGNTLTVTGIGMGGMSGMGAAGYSVFSK